MNRIQKRYEIHIGFNAETKVWHANFFSLIDGKATSKSGTSLRKLLVAMDKTIRKKELQVKKFPLPRETNLITLPQHSIIAPSIILPNGS